MKNPICSSYSKYEYSLFEKKILSEIFKKIKNRPRFSIEKLIGEEARLSICVYDHSDEYMQAAQSLRGKSFLFNDSKQMSGFIDWANLYQGFLQIQISSLIEPLLIDFCKSNPTMSHTSLTTLITFKSTYSMIFYTLSKTIIESTKEDEFSQKFTLEELRSLLEVKNKYSLYGAFKQKILLACQKELKDLYIKGENDITFNFSEISSKARKVEVLKFYFELNQIKMYS